MSGVGGKKKEKGVGVGPEITRNMFPLFPTDKMRLEPHFIFIYVLSKTIFER